MKPEIELAVMSLVAEARELYLTQEDEIVFATVKTVLVENLDEGKMNNEEYEEALKVLKRYKNKRKEK